MFKPALLLALMWADASQVYAKAAAEIDQDQLSAAHNTLDRAREVMAGGAKTLAAPKGMLELTAQVGALDYLAARLQSEAAPENLRNEEFLSLKKAVGQSVADLKAALFAQDTDNVKAAIAKLKGPYAKLFAKFG